MDNTIKAISLSAKFSDAPVVVVSEIGKESCIVLIYSDPVATIRPEHSTIVQGIHIVCLDEVNVMRDLLLNGGRTISYYFTRPIVIKDELHIVPLIMEYVNHVHNAMTSPICGNLVVQFEGINDSTSFYSNSLVPFFNISKGFLEKSDAFCLFFSTENGTPSVYACWEVRKDYGHRDFLRHLVKSIPEVNLHAMRIEYFPIASHPITKLQKWSTSRFLQGFGSPDEDDAVIREVFYQYLTIAKHLYSAPSYFLQGNTRVLHKTVPNSVSSISTGVIANSMTGDFFAKVLNEYRIILHKNMDALFSLLIGICSSWDDINTEHIPKDVCVELDDNKEVRTNEQLCMAYHTIASSSLLSPFHYGFFPFCINELLPVILHI